MIPYILAAIGGYLIGGAKQDSKIFKEGGMMEDGGNIHVDLFEYYDEMPPKLAKIINKYSDKFEDGLDYEDTKKMLQQVEKIGYTFDYGLDNIPYGLRPIGVELEQLKGYEEMAEVGMMAKGGGVNYLKKWKVTYITLQGKKGVKEITLGRMSDKEDVKQALKRMSDLNIREVTSIKENEETFNYKLKIQPDYPYKNIANRWLEDNSKDSLKYKLAVLLLLEKNNPDEILGILNYSQYASLLRSLEKAKGESIHEQSWSTNNYSLGEAEKWATESLRNIFYIYAEPI